MKLPEALLISAASLSFLVAALHVYVIARGAPAYRRFGAGERMAVMAEQGSWFPAALTGAITLVFLAFCAYYLPGAGILPGLPYLPIVMIGIAALYTLRGAMILLVWPFRPNLSRFEIVSSLVALLIGLLHFAALASVWPSLLE